MKIIQPPRKRGKSNSRAKDQIELVDTNSLNNLDSSNSSSKSIAFAAKPKVSNTRHHKTKPRGLDARRAKTSSTPEQGQNQSQSRRAASRKQDLRTRLYHKAIQLLARREHSISELRRKLMGSKALDGSSGNGKSATEIIEKILSQLVSENFLSDQRFAEAYVRARGLRGIGPIKLRAELNSKGVDSALIEELIDMEGSQWRQSAQQQYDKKYGDKPVNDYNEWTKRARFLQGRGFTMEHIKAAVPNLSFE
jgi:Uncharacterized protein conserved in bacteria